MGFWIVTEIGFKAEKAILEEIRAFFNEGTDEDGMAPLNALRERMALPEGGKADDYAAADYGFGGNLYAYFWTRCNWLNHGAVRDFFQGKYGDGLRTEVLVDDSDLDFQQPCATTDRVGDIFPHYTILTGKEKLRNYPYLMDGSPERLPCQDDAAFAEKMRGFGIDVDSFADFLARYPDECVRDEEGVTWLAAYSIWFPKDGD